MKKNNSDGNYYCYTEDEAIEHFDNNIVLTTNFSSPYNYIDTSYNYNYETSEDQKEFYVLDALIKWDSLCFFIERPNMDNCFVGNIVSNTEAAYVDNFSDETEPAKLSELQKNFKNIEQIVLFNNEKGTFTQLFDNIINVEDWSESTNDKKMAIINNTYCRAWKDISSELQRKIYQLGLNPNLYLDAIYERFKFKEFPSTITFSERVVKGFSTTNTGRSITYDPNTGIFIGNLNNFESKGLN